MTKIAIISDLHLKHWYYRTHLLNDLMPHQSVAESVRKEKPDLIIDAGDLELPELLQSAIGTTPLVSIPGNHEWYGKEFPGHHVGQNVVEIDGIKIITATLWTNLNNRDSRTCARVASYLNDFTLIKVRDGDSENGVRCFSADDCADAHELNLEFLKENFPADVVVTHHAPSFKSVHPKYLNVLPTDYLVNYGFASKLDDVVLQSGAKVWVHGHVHSPFDYMIGDTHVICWPCGYPFECKGRKPYAPVYIEV